MALLAPAPKFYEHDSNGDPLAGGLVYTYLTNTTTPLATYTDAGGGTANANPVVLDSAGRANIWLLTTALYKFVVKTSTGVTVYTVNDLAASASAYGLSISTGSDSVGFLQVGTGSLTDETVQDKLRQMTITAEDKGASTAASAATNTTAIRNAIASGKNTGILTAGVYSIDNTTPIELNIDDQLFFMAPGVDLRPTVPTAKVFLITAKNVTFEGGIITGDGTYNNTGSSAGRPISFIEAYNGVSPTSPQNVTINNVRMVNPNNAGVLIYRTVGANVRDCKISSAMATSDVDRAYGAYIYSSAQVQVSGNTIDGGSEGILGGAEDAGGYTFNDFAGETGKDTRDVIISNNVILNFRDHGVYFSSNSARVNVASNNFVSAIAGSSSGIKLYGSGAIDGNSIVSVNSGIQGRNSNQLVISNNRVFVTGTGTSVAIIDIDGSASYAQNVEDIVITGNELRASNAAGINKGIYIYGLRRTATGEQNLLKNINISGNAFSGTIGMVNGGSVNAVIVLYQENHNTAASSLYGGPVIIANNTASLEPATGPVYRCSHFVALSGDNTTQAGFDGGSITGNYVKNLISNFCVIAGKGILVDDNSSNPNAGNSGMIEVTNANTPSGQNYFGKMNLSGTAGGVWVVNVAVETTQVAQEEVQYTSSLTGTLTYSAARPYRRLVVTPTANRAIVLSSSAGSFVFPTYMLVTVHNVNAGAFDVTFELVSGGATVTVAANTSRTFMCVGSNTFIQIY